MILQSKLMDQEERVSSDQGLNNLETMTSYLTKRWQETVNLTASNYGSASIVCMKVEQEGCRILLKSEGIKDYYKDNRLYEVRGSDFMDLVRGYGRMLIIEDGLKDQRLEGAIELELGYRTLVGVPIYDEHQVMTAIFMLLMTDTTVFQNDDVQKLVGLTTGIEESIKFFSVASEIEEIRSIDGLTGLLSRSKLMELLQLEFDRSTRSNMPFSLVVIDIDNFKSINETFGHDVGDQVLKEFSGMIQSRIRIVDSASRWDGNAFIVLCPQTEMLGANILVDDLFTTLNHHIFLNVGRCYFSVGVADYSPKDQNINDILLRLDQALCRVKAFGGNSHLARYHQ